MTRVKRRRTAAVVVASAMIAAGLAAIPISQVQAQEADPVFTLWRDRFLEQYEKIKDPNSGYFSSQWGIPYHSVETLLVEAPEHGHQTTSEAFSYWLWLEAYYGRVTGDWGPFNAAWQAMETYIIPSNAEQPTNNNYNPGDPATYAPELDSPGDYPSPLDFNVPVGSDPLAGELHSAYGSDVYLMHWLLDVDDVHGYGRCGDGQPGPALVNTFQRGPQESVWQTVVHPSCERFNWGGPNGFLDLFIGDDAYAQQWRYTAAPDADARAIQAAYWASQWAENPAAISGTLSDATKMGDWLRYALADKYFKQIGNCVGPNQCPPASGKDSLHYLLQWYAAWGGGLDAGWAFRVGASHAHQGYQNPIAAYALSGAVPEFNLTGTGNQDWATSLDRQLEFAQWLQAGGSNGGFIAGGATNSWQGRYATPPAGTPTFYGMFYDETPVWHDPNSNVWFGFQVWSMQRFAEYLYVTGDQRAQDMLDRWVARAVQEITVNPNGTWEIPAEMSWTGAPATWNPSSPSTNPGLNVAVVERSDDVGVTSGLARTLLWYAAATDTALGNQAHDAGLALLEAMWNSPGNGPLGITVTEQREDYNRFTDTWDDSGIPITGMFIPPGWTGTMPNGDPINSNSTFLSMRTYYQNDPRWGDVQAYINGTGPAPTFNYHRFWAQSDVATAFADYAYLFGDPGQTTSPDPTTQSPDPTTQSPDPTTQSPDPTTQSPDPTTDPPGSCHVNYNLNSDWGAGFNPELQVVNNSPSPISGWQLSWTFPGGQQITQIWNSVLVTNGPNITVANESWNPTIGANGGSVGFGFLGAPGGATPVNFSLNGTPCTSNV